ncbi:VOC family protein [Haloferula sp. BvORR071]|uniref:VOC family protein n=1 Tax=Haloferula sp. BvORR071 TaxID=1396141 RepID=UPI0005531B5D|nr:VOC family protein [Haloferula sp. BvORR071]
MPLLFDHIDLRVTNLAAAEDFYRMLLPALGFEREQDIEGWLQFEDKNAAQFFGVTESPGHRPNENRIAFQAGSVEAVEYLAEIAKQAGAINIEGPMRYAEDYYAVFFEDPCGNRFEICHRL